MNLVDSSGWLEYFADEKNADFFAPVVEDISKVLVPVICLYEVYNVMRRERNQTFALQAVVAMQEGEIVEIDQEIAIAAANISYQEKLPMADSMIYAIAKAHNAVLWTQDMDFKELPGVKYIEK